MNCTVKELYERKSVRAYTDEPITEEEKELILTSAIQAPTAENMSLFSVIDVQSQEIKDILAERCDHQKFIASAPLVLVFLADCQKWYEMFQCYHSEAPAFAEGDLFLAMEDCMIAAQNAVTAAEALGIGSCYIGDMLENFEENQKLLHLPRYAVPLVLVTFGRPTEQQKNRAKPGRFCLNDMVFQDRYPDWTAEEWKDVFKRKTGMKEEELENYIAGYARRKFQADFKKEMDRSARAVIRNWIGENA